MSGIDSIEITLKNGSKKIAELISKFKVNNLGEYVIYRLDGKVCGAKYEFDGENTKLITDLTEPEKRIINEVFSQLEVE